MAAAALPPDASGTKKTWAIIGASRGIGHEFAEQLLAQRAEVYATVRGDVASYFAENQDLCHVLNCDVTSEASIDKFVEELAATAQARLDYVVVNAGVLKYPNRATEITFDDFAWHLHTNTIGPIICAQKLLQAEIPIGIMVFISSDSGSAQNFREIEDGFAAYAASKAALNMSLRHMAAELKRKGDETIILALHPGEVATDMASNDINWDVEDQMTPQESVAACIKVIESKGSRDSGTFWTWENKPYPW